MSAVADVIPLHGREESDRTPKLSRKEQPKFPFRDKPRRLVVSLTGGHVMGVAFIGLYFLLFQVLHGQTIHGVAMPDVKGYWDTVLSRHIRLLSQAHWDTWRHLFRNGGESYLAALALQQFLYNPYKHSVKRITEGYQIVGRFLLALLFAIPVFIGLGLLIHAGQHALHTSILDPYVGSNPNLAQKLYGDELSAKIVAFAAGILGARRPMLAVFDFNMRFFAERRVAKGKKPRWYHTSAYQQLVKDRYNEPGDSEAVAIRRQAARSNRVIYLVLGSSIATALLFGLGVYVLDYVA